jgi:hypothetical protein
MKTITCYDCGDFTISGKDTGYCNRFEKPTWKATVKKCMDYAREEAGDFCFYNCPFTYDHDGYMCGDEAPYVDDIHKCPIFNDRLNTALGGTCTYVFYYVNKLGQVVQRNCMLGESYDWVLTEETKIWQYINGWTVPSGITTLN